MSSTLRYNKLQTSQIKEIIHHINSGEIYYDDLSTIHKQNSHIVIAAVKKDISNIQIVPERFYDDYDVMLELVKYDGSLLWYVSEDLIQNHEIVLAAVRQNGMNLEIVYDYETTKEREFSYIDGYDRYGPCVFHEQTIDESRHNLVDNEEIVSATVAQNAFAYEFISSRLKQSREIALIAVNQNGLSLRQLSYYYRTDIDIMIDAVVNNKNALPLIQFNLKPTFSIIIKNASTGNLEYFYEKIIDGSIIPYTRLMVKLLSPEKYEELISWVKTNLAKNKGLFQVLFYKSDKNHSRTKIGYFRYVRDMVLSYLPPLTLESQLNYKMILERK
jgi:hypothetical protein